MKILFNEIYGVEFMVEEVEDFQFGSIRFEDQVGEICGHVES